jgi:hypothetical protein
MWASALVDWTVAFGMRHNTLRGLEETTSQEPRPDPPRIARASRLRSSRAGGRRLLLTSRLCLASVVVAAAAAGTGIFLLAHSAGEKAAANCFLVTGGSGSSNPSPSSGESLANLTSSIRAPNSATGSLITEPRGLSRCHVAARRALQR